MRSLSAEQLPVVLPLARSVTKAEKPPEGVAETMLVETSADGWGETNLKALAEGNGAIQKDPATRPARSRSRSAAGPADEKKVGGPAARLVVIGNSRFAGERVDRQRRQRHPPGQRAFTGSTGSEKQIGIAPKTPEQASLSLTDAQVASDRLVAMAGLPGLAILLGLWVWYRRRD